MSLNTARNKYQEITQAITGSDLVTNTGKLAAHTLFPNDFEFYLMAFELVDSDTGITTDRFAFPVMPDSIQTNDPKNTTIKKTFSGVTAFRNNSFIPKSINISGSFGRRFRLILGNFSTPDFSQGIGQAAREVRENLFVQNVKTGYGALKSLERLYKKASSESLSGKPNIVYFYNLSFNQSYIIEFTNLQTFQNTDMNMIWQYNLSFKAVAPSGILRREVGRIVTGTIGSINKGIQSGVSDIKDLALF